VSAATRALTVTVYPDRYSTNQPDAWSFTWEQLVSFCSTPGSLPPEGKDVLPFWHGAELRADGARRNADVVATHVLFCDVDGAIDEALALLEPWGIVACAFPSPSGKPGRGRILIPLAQPVNAREHKHLWRIVNARLGGTLDRQCIAPSHGFYTPAIGDPAAWWLRVFDGDWLDPSKFDLTDTDKPIRAPTESEFFSFDFETRTREVLAYAKQLQRAQVGQRHQQMFKLAQYCLDYALPYDKMRAIVLQYNTESENPKDNGTVEKEVISVAHKYRRNAIGCALTAAVRLYQDHTRTIERVLELLAEHVEDLYLLAGVLVEHVTDATSGDAFAEVSKARLHSLLTHYAHCYVWDEKKGEGGQWRRGAVPPWLAEEILAWPAAAMQARGIRPVVGTASAPQLRSDGSVLYTPGYDKATRLVYVGEPVDLPAAPTKADADAALWEVESLFHQFPWDNLVSWSVYTSYLLTAVARSFVDGPVPIGVFDATKKQSGKSKLADCLSVVIKGTIADSDAWPKDDDKMQETLHRRCANGDGRFILFDNVRNGATLESAMLDGSLTKRRVGRRRYFSQTNWDVPFDPIVFANGNGVSIGGDLRPRAMYCRLAPEHDNPEERRDLEIQDLVAHVTRNRLDICRALLTVWRAWLQAGSPTTDLPPWHTVGAWRCVRQVLAWLGRPDPYESRLALSARDSSAELHGRLLDWVATRGPLTASQLLEQLRPRTFGGAGSGAPDDAASADAKAELWSAVCQEAKAKGGDVTSYVMGWLLRRHHDAPLANGVSTRFLRLDDITRKWHVEAVPYAQKEKGPDVSA
jgi:hypothetical protein